MAWSRLQSAVASAASANPAATFTTANLTSGSVMVAAVVTTSTETVSSVKDGAGNSFTQIGVKAGTNNHVYLYALATPAGDAGTKPTITVTKSGNVNPSAILVQEVSGILATVDGTLGSLSGTGGTSTGSPTYSSTASSEYLVSVYGDNGGPETWTKPAALTADTNSINTNGSADLAIAFGNSTNGTEAGSWALTGTSANWSTLLVAFQLPTVSVALTTPNLALAAPALTVSAGATVALTTPNLALAAPLLTPGVVPPAPSGTWAAAAARNPVAFTSGAPALTPLEIPVSNTAGQWLFAVATWRQDAGIAGDLQYPSTVSVSDDAGNFWIPVESGTPATAPSQAPSTGILRCAVWMAPAARQAEFVFVAPAGYQSSLTAQVFQFPADCPWYQVQAQAETFTNQGTSISVTSTPANAIFTLGAVAWDNLSAAVTVTATGWTALATQTASNGSNHAGDLKQAPYNAVGAGSALTLSASSATTMDWAGVIVVVSGVSDTRAFPYSLAAQAGNWPVLVTEIAAGPAANADPVFARGTTSWSGGSAAVAAASWPQWSPSPSYQAVLYGSLQITPSGAAATSYAGAENEPVSPAVQYSALAWVYSPAGYGTAAASSGAAVALSWLTSGLSPVSVTTGTVVQLQPGEWTLLTLGPVFPPATAAFASLRVVQTTSTGSVPATAVLYAAYAAFSPADSYEGAPPDQISWTDVSTRNLTFGDVEWQRGIQYENQSLEAGTLTVWLRNDDAAMTFGNVQSPFWPVIGDTDVPFRLRAIWPGSPTPYYPLFSGYTDDVKFGWDVNEDTWYSYAQVTASDAWSRLTQQMLALTSQEALQDDPVAVIPCSQTGANIVAGSVFATTPAQIILVNTFGPVTLPAASFTGSGISLPGAPGLSCFQSSGTFAANTSGMAGQTLAWLPAAASLPVSAGVTVEFWFSPVSDFAAQPTAKVAVAMCQSSGATPVWVLWLDNTFNAGQKDLSFLFVDAYDKNGNLTSSTQVGSYQFLTTTTSTASYFCAVTFSQTSLTVTINPGSSPTETVTVTGLNMSARVTGLMWGGPLPGITGYGSMDIAVSGISIFNMIVPAARIASHCQAGLAAFQGETDTWRLARVASYSGFIPVLGMRGTGLPAAGSADTDIVTGATDTNTQLVSAYFTNIAQSTLALMFADGAGTLMYRRRLEWYNRPIGQWVLGETDSQSLSLGINPLSSSSSTAGWTTGNGATLTSGTAPAAGQLFVPSAGLFAGNGVTAGPFIATTSNPAVTPGQYYQFTVWLYSAQGWVSGGVNAQVQFFNASNVQVGATQSSPVINLAAGSVGYAAAGPVQAPAAAAYVKAVIQVNGTPPGTTGFYVARAQASQVTPDYAPGSGVAVPETPYMPDVTISSDRAQLFNYGVLTQYGTTLVSSFSGTGVLFTPSSGVIVIISNVPSISLRGQIPYTVTTYLDNTTQALPYQLDEGSIEDQGNWVTQTLGAPLFRPDKVTITPAATPTALIMALQAEVGDTVVFRRRQPGVPEMQILTYISKISHTVKIDDEQAPWTTEYELSPFPQGTALTADAVVQGVLTGTNLLGF